VGNGRRLGYFTVEEQAAVQHLANQVAASLKLQERQTMREQLFRSEKLAATGTADLRSRELSCVRRSTAFCSSRSLVAYSSLVAGSGPHASGARFALLAGESQRASEIVCGWSPSRHPEDSQARIVDINALLAGSCVFANRNGDARAADPEPAGSGNRLTYSDRRASSNKYF